MTFVDVRTRSLTFAFSAFTVVLSLGVATGGHAETRAAAPTTTANNTASNTASNTANDARIGTLIETLGKTRTPSSAAISPDGTTVAWAVRDKGGSQIHLTNVANPDPATEKIVGTGSGADGCGSSEPKWSPDGQWLAFVSDCTAKGDKQDQVFVWSKKTGESKQLTQLVGGMDSLAWSPDGKTIGFLFVENATRSAGALAAMKPWSGVVGEDGVEVQRIGVVEVASGAFSQVTPARLHVYEFGWSPDAKHLVFVGANPPGENNWWVAQLYTEELVGRADLPGPDRPSQAILASQPASILDPKTIPGSLHGLQIAVPRWSPEGTRIAFIGGLMSDQGSTGGDVYLIPATGGEPRDVTPGRDASVAFIGWGSPG